MKIDVPSFDQDNIERYLQKVKVWQKLCRLPETEQGLLLWYNLPDSHPSGIKDKIMNEIGLANLELADGVTKFVEAMESAFKPDDEVKAFTVYQEFFDEMERKPGEKIRDFLNRFDKAANLAKTFDMEI